MSEEKQFRWSSREQPPMEQIAKAVAELSGGLVSMTFPFTGSDEYALTVAQGNGERPAVYARFLRTVNPVVADHEIAAAWAYAGSDECAFWRELEAATEPTQ